ncbi:MAG: hypothetical protein AAF413_01920 [Patescibacteria group bacterium]
MSDAEFGVLIDIVIFIHHVPAVLGAVKAAHGKSKAFVDEFNVWPWEQEPLPTALIVAVTYPDGEAFWGQK